MDWETIQNNYSFWRVGSGFLVGLLIVIFLKWLRYTGPGRIPTPKKLPESIPVIGPMITLLKKIEVLNDWLYETTRDLGSTWTFWVPGQSRFVVISDPVDVEHMLKGNFDNYEKGAEFHKRFVELLGNGIFNTDGENWRHQRKTASELFKVNNFRNNMMTVFVEHADKFLAILSRKAETGEPIDLHAYFHRYTLDSIGQIGFGVDLNSIAEEGNGFADAFDGSQEAVNYRFLAPFWQLRKYLHPQEYQLTRSVKFLNDFTYKIVDSRLQDPDFCARNFDLLSIFIRRGLEQGTMPSREFLRDLVINFIIAGRDTTAQALSWMFYELITHPEEMRLVVQEIDDVVGRNAVPTYETLKKLPYLTATFTETLRLHPSVPKDSKMTIQDDVLPTSQLRVPAGTWVLYSAYGIFFFIINFNILFLFYFY